MTPVVTLPERLDLSTVGTVADAFRARMGGPVTIDAGAVTQLGALGVQVLLSAASAWSATGQAMSLVNPSAAFTAHAAELGLATDALAIAGADDAA
jgi:chemotaxis protein CheX